MRHVHKEIEALPRKERDAQLVLRAYMNLDGPLRGFRGKPLDYANGMRIEREINPRNLVQYMYVLSVLASADEEFDRKHTDPGNENHWHYMPRGPLKMEKIITISEDEVIKELASTKKAGREVQSQFAEFIASVKKMDDEVLALVNEIYTRAARDFFGHVVNAALMADMDPSDEKTWVLDFTRKYGRKVTFFHLLGVIIQSELESHHETISNEKERIAYSVAIGYFGSLVWVNSFDRFEEKENGVINLFGRPLFTREDTQAWQFLRGHLFDRTLTKQILLDAVKMEGRHDDPLDREYLDKMDLLLEVHSKYSLKYDFSMNICGSHFQFFVEASPFVGKWVGGPVANMELAVYPYDNKLRRWLEYMADPSFEHADGAIAVPSLHIQNGRLILEEIQGDVLDLSLRQNGFRIDDFDTAYSAIEPVAYRWHQISLAAVMEFARRQGFTEFYAATPWRIFQRYHGNMHPNKAENYFGAMMKNGGYLMHDYAGELGDPQYYWRFDVK